MKNEPTHRLQEQIESLKELAKTTGCIIVCICQLDRHVAERRDQRPTLGDIRLPNPLDLGLFNKTIFLYRENSAALQAEVSFYGHNEYKFKVAFDPQQVRFFDATASAT